MDVICVYRLCRNTRCKLCDSRQSWDNCTVCMVLYSIYVVKCSIFYCKQYSICIISYFLYKKQQGTCRDGIMEIYLCIFNKLTYSVCYSTVCKSSRRWGSSMENGCRCICHYWIDCKYNFSFFN